MAFSQPTKFWNGSNQSNSATSIAVTLPASIPNGAILIATATYSADTTWGYPSTFTFGNATGVALIESGSYSYGYSNPNNRMGQYQNIYSVTSSQSSTTLTVSGVTTANPLSLAVSIFTGTNLVIEPLWKGLNNDGPYFPDFYDQIASTTSGLYVGYASLVGDSIGATESGPSLGTGWANLFTTPVQTTSATTYNHVIQGYTWDNPLPAIGDAEAYWTWGSSSITTIETHYLYVLHSANEKFGVSMRSHEYTVDEDASHSTITTATAVTPLANFRAASGITGAADTATPFGDLTYTLPAGAATGDLLLAFYGGKPFDTLASTPTGYTAVGSINSSTTAQGNGVGGVRSQAFYKTHSGTESNPTSSFTAQYNPGMTAMIALSKSQAGSWTCQSVTGADSDPTGSTVSVTASEFLPFVEGDMVVIQATFIDDTADTLSTGTLAPAIDIPGCLVGTLTEQLATNGTTLGNDAAMHVFTATIISGSATDIATFTADTATNGDAEASVIFILAGPPGVGTRPPTTRTGTATATTVSPTTAAAGAKIHATTANVAISPTSAAAAIETLFANAGPNNNLINNSSFEIDIEGWEGTGTGVATLSQSSAVAFSGTKSIALTCTVAAGGLRMASKNDPVVTAGVTYTLSAYMRAAALATTADVGIGFYDAAGVIIGALTYGTGVTTSTSTWTRVTYTVTAPAGAVRANLSIRPRNTATSTIGEVQYIDAVQFEVAGAATAYVAPTQTQVAPTSTAAGTTSVIQFGTATTTTVSPTPTASAAVTRPLTGTATPVTVTTAAAGVDTTFGTATDILTTSEVVPTAAGTASKTATALNVTVSPTPVGNGLDNPTGVALTTTVSPTPAAAATVTTIHYGDGATTINPTPTAASTVTRPLTGTATAVTVATAAAATATKPATGTATNVSPAPVATGLGERATTGVGVTVTPTATALLGAKTIPATATDTTVTAATSSTPAAMTKTTTAAHTAAPAPLSAGVVTDEGATTPVIVAPSPLSAGVVTDLGTADTTTSPTTAAAGVVTDLGTADLTVTPIPTGTAVVTKPQTTIGVTVTPTPAAAPQAITKTTAASGTTTSPIPAMDAIVWESIYLKPDGLLVATGVTGSYLDIQDSPNSPDSNELAGTGGPVEVRFSFEDPGYQLRTQANDQTVRIRVSAV